MFRVRYPLMMPLLDGGGSGGEPPQAPTQAPTQAPPQAPPQTPSIFPDGLDDEIKNDPSLKVFINDNKLDTANLLKSYVHAQKKIGADKVTIPSKNATDEEWAQFYNKLGRPDLDKYDLKGEGIDEDTIKGFKEQAYKAGLLPKQAQAVLDWNLAQAKARGDVINKQVADEFEKKVTGLRSEWADAFDHNLQLANRALKEFATPEELQYFKESGLADNVELVKLFHRIGKGLKEDSFDKEAHGSFGLSKEDAQNKINEMYADFTGPYYNSDHPNHKSAVEQMYKLQQIMSR
jgi:hypothetical protein